MKESHRRYTNPFLFDVENDKPHFWKGEELESLIIEDQFIADIEDEKFKKSLVLCNGPSDSMENMAKHLYIDKNVKECKLPELITCYHEESDFHVVKVICVDEGLSHEEKIEIEKEHHELSCNPITGDNHDDMIGDNHGIQFSEHEQLISSTVENCDMNAGFFSAPKEKTDTNFHIPEDGNERMHIGYNHDDMIGGNVDTQQFLKHESTKSSSGEDCSDSSFGTKEKADTVLLIPEHTHDYRCMSKCNDTAIPGQNSTHVTYCEENAIKESTIVQNTEICSPGNSTLTSEGKLDSSSDSLNNYSTEQSASCSTNQDQLVKSIKVLESSNNVVDQQLSEAQSPEGLGKSRETVTMLTEVEMEENIPSDFDNVNPEAISSSHKTDNPESECVHEPSPDTQSSPNHQDVALDKVIMASQLQHGGELSLSTAGPVSGLITYSGPIASSGSMSHRSDSSNTSIRSFAFPILQTEWDSSPIRMTEVDQRHSPKHRGWRHSIMCCRF